jgi:hypothetical protein
VQNMIPVPMCVEAIQFEPNPLFDLRDLNTIASYVKRQDNLLGPACNIWCAVHADTASLIMQGGGRRRGAEHIWHRAVHRTAGRASVPVPHVTQAWGGAQCPGVC